MTSVTDDSPKYGIFSVPPNQRANGSLTLAGRESQLYLWSDRPLEISTGTTITGELDNLTKVSLIGCNIRSEGHVGKGNQIRYKYFVSPQCVLFGSRYISHNEDVVREISFKLEHAVALFHDSDAYSTIFNNSAATAMVAKIDNPGSSIEVEGSSWISYYTGKKTVFTSDTVIGQVSANHIPVFTIGNDHDHGLEKATELSIKFDDPLPVIESLNRMGRVLQFFDLVVGYAQNVSSISVHTGFDDPSQSFELYATGYAGQHSTREESESGIILRTTVLIHPVDDSTKFANILRAWLDRDVEWRTARIRLSHDWGKRFYNYNRLIAAANVFDLLPNDVYGNKPSLPSDLSAAVDASRKIFRSLPQSEERDDMLGHLGRVGGWRLKRKISFRAKNVCDSIGQLLPDLGTVIVEAVNLRNHYVHGTPSRIRIDQRLHLLHFLTNSLEFIFFASDFIDSGWNIVDWCNKAKPRGHPFHDYLVNFQEDLKRLKGAFESAL